MKPEDMYIEWQFSEKLDKLIIEFMEKLEPNLDHDAIIRRLAQKILDVAVSKKIGEYAEHCD